MASEELGKPSSLPPYPQMILEAVDAVKQAEGGSLTSISKYMESKYGEMPAGHADLLSFHLNAMKDSGELLFVKNNYLKPGADAPPKRGRGRPPKAKDPAAAAVVVTATADAAVPAGVALVSPPRGRGRPKKDPNAPPVAKKPKTTTAAASSTVSGRPRGRPRKVQPQPLQNGVEA